MLSRLIARLSTILAPQETITDADTDRGRWWLMAHGVGVTSMVALQGGPFLPAFALALGGTSADVGLLATIALGTQAMQLPGLCLLQRFPRRRLIIVATTLCYRLGWLLIALIPFLFLGKGVGFFLGCLLVTELLGALSGPAWNSLMGDIVPEKIRGTVFSTRLMLGTLAGLALTLLGGWFVDAWKVARPELALVGYSVLFGVGILFGLVGTFAVTRFPEPALPPQADIPLAGLLKKPVEDRNFRKLLAFVAVWSFAINLSGPFFIVYMLRRLELTLFMVTLLAVASQVANLVFLRIWGRMADRFSNKSVLSVSCPLFLVAVLGWTFTTLPDKHALTIPLLFGIQLLSGMSLAGVSIASANIALKLSPKGLAHAYMTVHGIVGAVTGAVAPVIGGVMASFFEARQLAVTLNWAEPSRQVSFHAMNLRSLDFLFFLAFLVGGYALHRLALVHEEGEVDEEEVRAHLFAEIAAPFRMVTTMAGLRHLVTIPMSAIHRLGFAPRSDDAEA